MILVVSTSAIGGCRLWQPVQADSQPKSSGLVLGRRPLGIVLHSSNELGELSQWLCHDDSTINIVLDIIIIIIIKLPGSLSYWIVHKYCRNVQSSEQVATMSQTTDDRWMAHAIT